MDALLTFADGDTDYVGKFNANGEAIVTAVTGVEEGKQDLALKGLANGYPGLDGDGQISVAHLTAVELLGNKGQINGYAPLNAVGRIPSEHLPEVPIDLDVIPSTISIYYPDAPTDGGTLARILPTFPIIIPAGATSSRASAATAATAETVLTIERSSGGGGFTPIGTITFAAAGTAGTFDFDDEVTLDTDDVLRIVNQATADDTLAGISISLHGTRG